MSVIIFTPGASGAVTHHGAYYETRKAKLYTRSEHAVPLYISAMVPNSARVAGKYGDGLITVGGETSETYRQMIENFDAAAKEAGKIQTTCRA